MSSKPDRTQNIDTTTSGYIHYKEKLVDSIEKLALKIIKACPKKYISINDGPTDYIGIQTYVEFNGHKYVIAVRSDAQLWYVFEERLVDLQNIKSLEDLAAFVTALQGLLNEVRPRGT